MSISVKKHPEHKLKYPRFLCDFPLKEDAPPPFDLLVSGFKFIVICGKPQSGKSSLLVSFLRDRKILRKTFNHVVAVVPESSRKSMKKDVFADLPPDQLIDDLEEPGKLLELVKQFASEEETTLVILDDQQSYLKMAYVATVINHIVANRRHLRCTVVCLLQTYNMLPLKTRKLINILITFKPQRKEWASISSEMLELPEEETREVFDYAFKNKDEHAWLLIDNTANKIFAGFDEIKLS